MALTCPQCHAELKDQGDSLVCRCGAALKVVDVPEQPCARCGGVVPLLPGQAVARCQECGRPHADAPLRARATCPNCRRRLEVGLDQEAGECPHCGAPYALRDR